jgi:hypothetical protein
MHLSGGKESYRVRVPPFAPLTYCKLLNRSNCTVPDLILRPPRKNRRILFRWRGLRQCALFYLYKCSFYRVGFGVDTPE